MAIKKEIEININANGAEQDLKDLNKQFEKLDKSADDLRKNGGKALDNIDKNVKETEKSTKSLAEGFKGAGLALKAMGIGLVISALSTLKDVFMSNQKVSDTFSAVLGTVANVFSQVTNVVVSVIEKVGGASNGFEGLGNVIGGLLKLSLVPLKAAFFGIKLVIDEVRLAWEESIFGDGDPKTIKELTKRIEETKVSLKKVGTDAVAAGKQVGENIGKAVDEVGKVVEGTIDGVSKISVKAAYEQAKANVNLQNAAILAEANQARLVEQYDRQAEKLRQVRDEERNSVEDRIKANNDLNSVLDKQEQAMLGQASAQIAAAKSTLAQNNNIENQAALTRALTNQEGVLAQIEGLRSEQKANDLALDKELKDLAKTKLETETELAINQKKFTAERLSDTQLKLEAQKKAAADELIIEQKKLDDAKLIYKEGTQARVDAEKEFALKKQELENQIILADDQLFAYRENKKIEQQKVIIENESLGFASRLLALQEQDKIINESILIGEEEKNTILADNAKKREDIIKAEAEFKEKTYRDNYNNLQTILSMGGKGMQKVAKALAIADVARTAAMSISKSVSAIGAANTAALATPQAVATGGAAAIPAIIMNTVKGGLQIGATVASAAKAIATIRSEGQSTPSASGTSSGGGGGGGSAAPAPPQFNVVGGSTANQLAGTLGAQQPVQAFVVANQVTSQQSMDRNIVNNASIG
ncbi:MAG: hypothetical protein ACOVK2_04400 [Candidatus Fonsibacter sp.]